MLLTLQDATEENGIYTWRFPSMKFVCNICSYNEPSILFCVINNEVIQPIQVVPCFIPHVFEIDHYSIVFTNDLATKIPILLTELAIDLNQIFPSPTPLTVSPVNDDIIKDVPLPVEASEPPTVSEVIV